MTVVWSVTTCCEIAQARNTAACLVKKPVVPTGMTTHMRCVIAKWYGTEIGWMQFCIRLYNTVHGSNMAYGGLWNKKDRGVLIALLQKPS